MATSHLEQIARIIDPIAWGGANTGDRFYASTRKETLEKARTILAIPPSPDARNAALEDAIIWHKEKQIHFEERENYFRHGNGYRTHCRGSIGAEDAADDFKRLASHHRESAKALLALQSPRAETPKSVAKETVARWLKDPAVKEALHRAPAPSADVVERATAVMSEAFDDHYGLSGEGLHPKSAKAMAQALAATGLLTGGKEGSAHNIACEAYWALASGDSGMSYALTDGDPVLLETVDGTEKFGEGWFVVNRPLIVSAGLLPAAPLPADKEKA